MARTVHVTAPTRLHFGMLAFGDATIRQFGGVGVMVQQPAVRLRLTAARQFEVVGQPQPRVRSYAQRWAHWRGLAEPPPCRVEILATPRLHTGLGAGTQLGLALASGLNAWAGYPPPALADLAESVQRGLRSAVGTYGFAHGGLVAERGKLPHERLSPLDRRIALPDTWRFVIVCLRGVAGLHGHSEKEAFRQLPAVDRQQSDALARELQQHLLPAAAAQQFEAFSDSVYRFGRQAGACFASVQGGPYNGPQLERLVQLVRDHGVRGVGQSSWGPAVFALCRGRPQARELVENLDRQRALEQADYWTSSASNDGARIDVEA